MEIGGYRRRSRDRETPFRHLPRATVHSSMNETNLAANLTTLMGARRSIRRFRSEPVPDAVVRRILGAACLAPSSHNRQPWRFAVVTLRSDKDRLAREMGKRLRADRLRDGDDPADVEADALRSYSRITGAPVVIVVSMTMEEMDSYPDEGRAEAERMMAVQSVAMAGYGLLLAAAAEGLGSCWLCAPLFAPQGAIQALGLPLSWQPQGLVLLGWPADKGKERGRRPVEEVTRYLS
jgi:coenzyme F420-0:L-glutamate ligase/coenzyme F420-1:gamma-L-glutamate ligase